MLKKTLNNQNFEIDKVYSKGTIFFKKHWEQIISDKI